MAYDFHYTPTGTGVISGKEVLEQTEDAINDLGNTAISGVEEALDKAEQALTNSANAVDDAQTALNTANNAEGVAIQAQNDVGNLSGTVTNIGSRVTTAEGNISNLQGRMTTAEGNITNLQGRMTTAETNIGNLQTAVSTAQATANSAQQTANTARAQSYVLRYSSTAITDNSTIAYSTLDNTDNIKASDKIIDTDGKIFSVVSVDSDNSTVTVGSALIDLAQDSDVVHVTGNETIGGKKTFSDYLATRMLTATGMYISDEGSNNRRTVLKLLAGARDTDGYSCSYVTRVRTNKAQGALISSDVQTLGFDFVENQVRTLNTFIIRATDWLNDVPQKIELTSNIPNYTYGNSTNKAKINDLNPGALGMPDLDNGVDISSYFDLSLYTGQTYTPTVNGWISFSIKSPNRGSLLCESTGIYQTAYGVTDPDDNTKYRVSILIPCLASQTVTVYIRASSGTFNFAKFYPCQGNV